MNWLISKRPLFFIMFVFFFISPVFSDVEKHKEIFEEVYRKKQWGINAQKEGFSGSSSLVKNTRLYRKFLQKFLSKYEIQSVVDLGCGDWEFSHLVDWSGVNYVGYDVVSSVIEKDIARFSAPNISFVCESFFEADLPEADLMICKNVLQHFSIEDIQKFLMLTKKFKYCLIANRLTEKPNVASFQTASSWHGIDLSLPPFNVKGDVVLIYHVQGYIQEVFLIDNTE